MKFPVQVRIQVIFYESLPLYKNKSNLISRILHDVLIKSEYREKRLQFFFK